MPAGPAIEMWSRQNASEESQDGRVYTITVQQAFTVTLAATDPIEASLVASGLPFIGDIYPGTAAVRCTKRTPTRVSPILAIVACEFKGESSPENFGGNPIPTEVFVSWTTASSDEPIDTDWTGQPIVTANNEPIDGLTERLDDDVVTIKRKFLTVNRYAVRQYRRATNSDTFLEWPPGTARIIADTSDAVFVNGVVAYWDVSVSIRFREPFLTTPEQAWYKRVRHEGLLVRATPGASPKIAWDEGTNTPVTRPILLKPDGTRETDPDNAYWLFFQTLGSLPFNALGLLD
jgi:hypothetical protein